MERLGLVEAIQALRQELSDAIQAGGSETLRFKVGEIELGFQVVVERLAKGGVKFWVVELGGEASKAMTHTVRVPLTPQDIEGKPVLTDASRETPPEPAIE